MTASTAAQAIKKSAAREARRLARLTAVQALYQADVMQQSAVLVLKEFESHRLFKVGGQMWLHDADTGARMGTVDVVLMRDVVALALSHHEALQTMITENLPKEWPLNRLEKPLAMILFAGAAELYQNPKHTTAQIISDYVDIAHAFYEGREPGMVNAILDKIAKITRTA